MDLVFKGGRYLKEILMLNSFSFEDKDPRFTRLIPSLALRLLSKGLFCIRAMRPPRFMEGAVSRFGTFTNYVDKTR